MKKVFDRRVLVKFQGDKEWNDTSIFHHYVYTDEEFEQENFHYEMKNFTEAYNFIREGYLRNAEISQTFLTKKPQIKISIGGIHDIIIKYTEKNFKPFEVKIVYENINNVKITTLADLLNADEFCEYLRDRDIPYMNF